MPKVPQKKAGKRPSRGYKFDSKGRIIGPYEKKVALTGGDTPIVISGGSLRNLSDADLEDDDHPGQKTKQLHSVDQTIPVVSFRTIQLLSRAQSSSIMSEGCARLDAIPDRSHK